MRLFIALDVNKPTRTALAALQEHMRLLGVPGAYVPPQNFHVTLRFLGETARIGEIGLALAELVRGIRPFSLSLAGYETFGGRTAVVRAEGDGGELRRLFESAQAALSEAGFPMEKRPLAPHITLARRTAPHPELAEKLNEELVRTTFPVDHVTLYESRRNKQGEMEYHPLQKNGF